MPAGLSLAGAAVDVESIGASAAKGAIKEDSIVRRSSVFNADGDLRALLQLTCVGHC